MKYKPEIKFAFKASIPIMMGYLLLGSAFALLAGSFNLDKVAIILMSVFIYAGALQFITVSFINAKLGLLDVFIASFFISFRQAFYSLSFLKKYHHTATAKPYLFFSLTDETYGLITTIKIDKSLNKKYCYLFLSLFNQSYWIIGTILGVLLNSINLFDIKGIEFSLTALFVVLAIQQHKIIKKLSPFIIASAVSLFALVFVSQDNMLLFSIVFSLLGFFIYNKIFTKKDGYKKYG